jgi:uncharacterized protein (TIGR00369 family)
MEEERRPWEDVRPDEPHVWRTLGYRRLASEPGYTVIEWDAPAEFSFPAASGPIVHGGMVATLLDTAMGGACWTVLDDGETFLTADLRVEFFRSARPGKLRAEGRVLHRTKRVAFCGADLQDAGGTTVASARCTQIFRSSR